MEATNIRHGFIKYVSQGIIGMIGLSCYILADTYFIAQGVGANGLTALNLVLPVYSFISGAGLMIGMGGATRFALSKSKTVFTQSLYYLSIIAALLMVVGLFFCRPLSGLLGADGETLEYANTYLRIILFFAPMFLLNNVVLCFVRNDGKPRLAMVAMLVGSGANIVLDYIFIFPLKMGMFGAALATGVAPVIGLAILSIHFIKKQNTFAPAKTPLRLASFGDISCLGVSALITELSSGVVIIVFNSIILRLEGNIGVAAYGVIANIALIVVAIFNGIAQGMQPLLSICFREQRSKSIQTVLRYGIVTAVAISAAVYLLSAVFASALVGAFNRDANALLAQISVRGIRIYFTAFAFVGINILSATYFSAIDRPKNAFVISLLRGFVVIVPMAFVLSALFGMDGVWMTLTATEAIVLLLTIPMMRRTAARAKQRNG